MSTLTKDLKEYYVEYIDHHNVTVRTTHYEPTERHVRMACAGDVQEWIQITERKRK